MVGWDDQGRTGKKVEELDAGIGLEGRRRKGWNGVKEGAEGSGAQQWCTASQVHTEHRTLPTMGQWLLSATICDRAQLHTAVCRHVAICSATLASFLDNDHQRA